MHALTYDNFKAARLMLGQQMLAESLRDAGLREEVEKSVMDKLFPLCETDEDIAYVTDIVPLVFDILFGEI